MMAMAVLYNRWHKFQCTTHLALCQLLKLNGPSSSVWSLRINRLIPWLLQYASHCKPPTKLATIYAQMYAYTFALLLPLNIQGYTPLLC